MKKLLPMMLLVVTFSALMTVTASAVVNDTVKVGLRYGSNTLFSANLENEVGGGYSFGYFEDDRTFTELGDTDETAISMTEAGTICMDSSGNYSASGGDTELGKWHIQLNGYSDYDDARSDAEEYGGWPAWIEWEYVVRIGCFDSEDEASDAMHSYGVSGSAVSSSRTGVIVSRTRTAKILFEFDAGGILNLGVMPDGCGDNAVTWFKGNKYCGGFEYPRVTGGELNVINVVDLEDYVKGVVPYEMSADWPTAALEAQAVCSRTFACATTKHKSYGFDVCNTSDCQTYYGVGRATDNSNRAVDNTAGECMFYEGSYATGYYCSADGGATEDATNVWGGNYGYLIGKLDPYEAATSIPNYAWSVTYTPDQLTYILSQKGYSVGTVTNVYVSEFTPVGNVKKVTFVGSNGTKTVSGDTCRTIFYSSTYNKSVKSLRYTINGAGADAIPSAGLDSSVYVNSSAGYRSSWKGLSVLSGNGKLTSLDGDSVSVITSSGITTVSGGGAVPAVEPVYSDGDFVISGTGSGHNVGMSQYGAKAMAEQGFDYDEILNFYFTNISIR